MLDARQCLLSLLSPTEYCSDISFLAKIRQAQDTTVAHRPLDHWSNDWRLTYLRLNDGNEHN